MSEWDCRHGNSLDLCPVCFRERIAELEAKLKAVDAEALEELADNDAQVRRAALEDAAFAAAIRALKEGGE